MSNPRSVRFPDETLARLNAYAARHPGMTSSSAAALLVEEGLRMDAHPGVVFRDGPAGRRAGLAGGADVWEVVRSIRDARAAEPDLSPTEIMDLVHDNTGIPLTSIRVAVRYYADHPTEVDALVAAADTAQEQTERAVRVTQSLLDAS